MSDQDTSSADPEALLRFAEAGLRMNAQLEAGAMSLSAAIAEFEATCTEYPTGIGQELADELRGLARRNVEMDLWVRSVAQQFIQADAGAVVSPTVGFSADGSVLAQEDWLGPLWQAVVAELPPEVAAQVVVLLNAGNVDGALMVAGVLPTAADDDTGLFNQVELGADGTPSAVSPDGWDPILPLSIAPNAADPYAIEIALEGAQVQQFLSPVSGIDLSNRQGDPWNVALDGLKLVLSAMGDAPSDCNDAFVRVAQAASQGPDAVRDALEKSRPGCNQSRTLIRLSGVMADGTPIDVQAEATLNQFVQQMTAMADGLGGGELGGRRPAGIPGSDAARVLSPAEQATQRRLEALPEMAGREFAPGAHPGEEVVDDLGNHYDFTGDPDASQYWKKDVFLNAIRKHLLKSNTITVIDLTGFATPQIDEVVAYLKTLTDADRAKIIRIGF